MTHIHKTSFCVLYILIFISCFRGEAMNVNNTSLIEITTTDSCSADQDMELKPRAVPAGKIQMVPLNQLMSRANMNQRKVGLSLNQIRARPTMNQMTVGLMQIQRTVVRQRSPHFRPNMNKYPKGAVYARYRVPPIYVTFKCPPKVGLLLCRASCERRSKYTIGSCDNGYCTCLLLTPGFRGNGSKKKGVFARRANCSLKEDRTKCNRFCRHQFGRTAYGLCRGTVCRCFTNPGISTKNQMTACEQARRRLAFLEARLRKILRKEPSTRTPAERRFLQEVRKRPEVLRRLATPRGRRSPKRMPHHRGTRSPGSPGSRKPQPTLQQTIPLSKIPNGNKYTRNPRKSPARATKYVPDPSKSPHQSPRRNQRTGKSNSRKGGSNSRKGGSNSRKGGSNSRKGGSNSKKGGSNSRKGGSSSKKGGSNSKRAGSSPRKGGSSSKQAPKMAQSPLKNRRQSPGNGGFGGVPARRTRKEEDDDDSGESGSPRNGGNGGGRNGGVGGRADGGGGQGGGYGQGRGGDDEDGDEFGRGGGGGRGGGVGGGQGGGYGRGKGEDGEDGEDGDEFGRGGGGGRGGGVGGGQGGGYGRGRGEDGEDGDEFGRGGGGGRGGGSSGGRGGLDGGGGSQRGGRGGVGGGGFLGGGRGGLGGGEESRSGGRNGLAGGGGSRRGGNGGYDTPGKNGYASGGQKYGQGYGGRGNQLNSEEDDWEENNRRGLNGGGRLAGDVPNYGRTDSRRGGRGSVTPSVTPSATPASTPRSGKQAQKTLGRDDPAIHVGGKLGDPAERSLLENRKDALEQERAGIDPKTGKEVAVPPPPSRQGGRQDLPIPPGAREEVKVDPVTGQTYLPNHESKPILPEEGACPIPPAPGVQDRLRDSQGLREEDLRNQGGLRDDLRDQKGLRDDLRDQGGLRDDLRDQGGLRDDLRDNRNLGYEDDPPHNRGQGYRGNQGGYEDDYGRPGRGNRNNQGGYYGGDEELLDQWDENQDYDPDDDYDYEQRNRNPRGGRPSAYDDEVEPRYEDRLGAQYQRESEYPQYPQQQGYGNRRELEEEEAYRREMEEEEAYRREQELMQRPRPRY